MTTCSQCETELPGDSLFCPRCGAPAADAGVDELLASAASDPTGLLDRVRAATAGEFTIIRELGRGGMGRVYLAHEIALERRVAVKVLPPAFADHTAIVQRFQREARTAGKLNHPHIVPVYQVSERAGLYFFTMPYVAGPDLRQILRQTPQLSFEVARRYLHEAADALDYAHGRGVIHRDIKPENMLMEGSRDGRLMLTDFGIAKALGVATTLTRPGDMMGTPYFMSPEQCEEAESVDGRSDQYSLGLVAYELLAGRFPFTADSLAGIVYKHLHEYPEPLETIRPDVPGDLRCVVERAIRKDPGERFPTMAAFREALEESGARTVAGDRMAAAAPEPRAPGRRRWLAVAAVAAIAVAGAFVLQQRVSSAGSGDARLAELGMPGEEAAQSAGGEEVLFGLVPAELDSAESGAETPDSGTVASEPAAGRDEPEQAAASIPVSDAGQRRDEQMLAARTETEEARAQAEHARRAALDAGADTLFPDKFSAIDDRFSGARGALRDGEIVAAAAGFGAAIQRFDALAEEARQWLAQAARPGPDSLAAEAGEASPGDEAPVVMPPREAIAALLEVYRESVEAEDLNRLAQEVYRGPIPRQDEELLDLLFRRGEKYQVTIELENLEIADDAARAKIKQKMRYELARTREDRRYELSLQMFFERKEQGWRLLRLER